MNWLTDFVRPKIKKTAQIEIADNLWLNFLAEIKRRSFEIQGF